MGVGHSPSDASAKLESRSSCFREGCRESAVSSTGATPPSSLSRRRARWSLFQRRRLVGGPSCQSRRKACSSSRPNLWKAHWVSCQTGPTSGRGSPLAGNCSFSSQNRRQDCRRHRRQSPSCHSRLQRLPATRRRSDQGCFVSFSCLYGVVLNLVAHLHRRRARLFHQLRRLRMRKYSQKIRRVFYQKWNTSAQMRLSLWKSTADAHRFGQTVAPQYYANRHSYRIQGRCALEGERQAGPPPLACARGSQEHFASRNVRRPACGTLNEISEAAFVRVE